MEVYKPPNPTDRARWSSAKRSFGEDTFSVIQKAKVLVIGSGGIGCELLKNLVLSGFKNIEIVDLDTIDISNLNRQFLFRRKHVGLPKSVVARESALHYVLDSECDIKAHHDDVKTLKYGPEYIKQFDIILNALDNLSARRHVGRVCWSADIPYVESGTAGWFGQVQPFIPGQTGCYECDMKPPPTTFPVCTIRSNPSKPIHTIMWAKHLFHLLFGKVDEENEVLDLNTQSSPNDTLNTPDAPPHSTYNSSKSNNDISTELSRSIAKDQAYLAQLESEGDFAQITFHKVFSTNILKANTLTNLWTDRDPPKPYTFAEIKADPNLSIPPQSSSNGPSSHVNATILEDQKLWSILQCAETFLSVCTQLKAKRDEVAEGDGLSWDKDEPLHLDFVVAASNLRSYQYGIPLQSKFTIKSDAGNIIPAIATTNAIIAGLIVIEAIKILTKRTEQSKSVYLVQTSRKRSMLMNDTKPYKNPKCYVCSNNFIHIKVDTRSLKLKTLVQEVFEKQLGVVEPSVMVGDDIIYETDGDMENQLEKRLEEVKIRHSAIVHVESFVQDFKLEVSIEHAPSETFEESSKPYQVVGSAAPSQAPKSEELPPTNHSSATIEPTPSDAKVVVVPDTAEQSLADGDVLVIEDDDDGVAIISSDTRDKDHLNKKRPRDESTSSSGEPEAKKQATLDEVVLLDD